VTRLVPVADPTVVAMASGADVGVPDAVAMEADAVAAAVRGCPAVDGLCRGAWGGVVTYLPGRQVPGVRLAADHLVISVRSRWGAPAAEVAAQIRAATAALAGPRRIDIVIADVADADVADKKEKDRT
jgi:hypothetical protein